jgi:hypothetical protein
MSESKVGKKPEIQPALCDIGLNNFHIVQDIDKLREVVRCARERDVTQKKIIKDAELQCQEAQFSKWLNCAANLGQADINRLQAFAVKALADCVDIVARRHNREFKIDACIDRMVTLYGPLARAFVTHESQMRRLHENRIVSYYNAYKYSYRRHGEILKSAAVVTHYRNDPSCPLIYIEKQINADGQREDAAGVLFSKSYTPWLIAQEVVEEQPRMMQFTRQETGFDDHAVSRTNHGTAEERLQYLCGFILEAYARWDSYTGAPKGGFMAPIALQRVPEKSFAPDLGIDEAEVFREANRDRVLGQLLAECGYLTRDRFLSDATISQVIRDHMQNHPWGDTSNKNPLPRPWPGGLYL